MIRDTALDAVCRLALRAPRLVYGAAGPLARPGGPLRSGSPDDVHLRRLMPQLSAAEREAARRGAQANRIRDRVLIATRSRHGYHVLQQRLADPAGLPDLAGPVVLGMFHAGPLYLLAPALGHVPHGVIVMRSTDAPSRGPNMSVQPTEGREAEAFYAGLRGLRAGKSVFVAIDGFPETVPATLFGRSVCFARGPFAMSRIARVPIIPIVVRWEGSFGRVVLGEPIGPADDEGAAAAAAAAWYERYLTGDPTQVGQRVLGITGTAPRLVEPPPVVRAAPSRSA